jgi:hypothetical protein
MSICPTSGEGARHAWRVRGHAAPGNFEMYRVSKMPFLRFGVKFCALSRRGTKRKLMTQDHFWWLLYHKCNFYRKLNLISPTSLSLVLYYVYCQKKCVARWLRWPKTSMIFSAEHQWRSWNRCQDGICFIEDWSPSLEMPVYMSTVHLKYL